MTSRVQLTVRMRLTLLYGGMLLVAGGILIAIFYVIFRENFLGVSLNSKLSSDVGNGAITLPSGAQLRRTDLQQLSNSLDARRQQALDALLWECLAALAAVAVIAVGFGWLMAGRALRPVHDITATARRVADRSLHERIALAGPNDELKELADTFDAMLQRLDASFESQRRFVANASHELRTPLATSRTLLEVALAQHDMPSASRQVITAVLAANHRNEQLVEGLLALARSENQAITRLPVDLSDVAAESVEQTAGEAAKAGVTVDAEPNPAPVVGDPVLLERLALNLMHNGIRHNAPGGWVKITTGASAEPGWVELTVANSGPPVPSSAIPALFEPFRRLGDTRAGHDQGVGLGLSIVRSIVSTHGGELDPAPRPGGGLTVRVRLPAPAAS